MIDGILPRLDIPELLLERFTEACNVGLVPIDQRNVSALTRARLKQVDQGYLRAETMAAANARLVAAQVNIDRGRGLARMCACVSLAAEQVRPQRERGSRPGRTRAGGRHGSRGVACGLVGRLGDHDGDAAGSQMPSDRS